MKHPRGVVWCRRGSVVFASAFVSNLKCANMWDEKVLARCEFGGLPRDSWSYTMEFQSTVDLEIFVDLFFDL